MPREILVDWTTPAGTGFRTVTYWDQSLSVSPQRDALGALFGSIDNLIDSNTVWTVETSGRQVDDSTGTLTGVWSEASAETGAGTVAGQCVPDAAQILLRWNTTDIAGGRFVKGRSFVPGLSTASVTEGNLSAAAVTAFQTAVNTFIAANVGFGIWHRPVNSAGGSFHDVVTGSVWPEFAVLRRRRG